MKLHKLEKMRIVHYPDPVLMRPATPVPEPSGDLRALSVRMFELLREAEGLGLAAPQVGVGIRMFVYNPTGEPDDGVTCVNPSLTDLEGAEEKEEGCLSLPGVTVTMRRATRATLEFTDLGGTPHRITGTELATRIWQHEIDHLDGRLLIDAMSPSDEIANRRAIKQLKENNRLTPRR